MPQNPGTDEYSVPSDEVAKSVNNAFIAYSNNKKTVDEVGAIVYKSVPTLDKLLENE